MWRTYELLLYGKCQRSLRCILGSSKIVIVRNFSAVKGRGTPAILSPTDIIEQARKQTELHAEDQFKVALQEFLVRDKHRRTHLKFIGTALEKVDGFGLQKNIQIYKDLLDLFPKGRFVNRTLFDALWPRRTPQMELALKILQKMEDEGIRPDDETHEILLQVFGRASYPLQKCRRMVYWFDRYENIDPYKLKSIPTDPVELSRIALKQMDKDGTISEHKITNTEYVLSSARYVSVPALPLPAKSSLQNIQVEGPHNFWLQKLFNRYFTLTATHPDREGTLLSICMCHPRTRENLKLWVDQVLEKMPALANMTVIYDIKEYDISEDEQIKKLNSVFLAPPKP